MIAKIFFSRLVDLLLHFEYEVFLLDTKASDNHWVQFFSNFFHDTYSIISGVWHYRLFSTEGQSVTISNLVVAIISLILGFKIARYLSSLIHHKLLKIINLDITVTNLLGKIVYYLLIIILTILILDMAHVPLTVFTFIGGALALSIGVGSQHVVNNFISGIILLIENFIKVGDYIEIENITGRVESIDARSINIRTHDNKNVFIPHSIIMQNKVINWTADDNRIRASIHIAFNHDMQPASKIKEIILNALAQNKNILISPSPQVLLIEFENNIMVFEINFWINIALINRLEVISEINYILSEEFTKHKISLAIEGRMNC